MKNTQYPQNDTQTVDSDSINTSSEQPLKFSTRVRKVGEYNSSRLKIDSDCLQQMERDIESLKRCKMVTNEDLQMEFNSTD
jgi:hypothetical protein